MNPIRTRTSVGLETPNQTVARAQNLIQIKPRTGFTVPLPESVPAEALNGNFSISDVRAQRDNREQADTATSQFNTDFNALNARIGNTTPDSPFVNPEQFLNRLLLRGNTETQTQLDETRQNQADRIGGFAREFTNAADQAREDLGVPELQANLAETRTRIAERTNNLRQTIRDFEVNGERRGVAREFVQSEKQAIQQEAATELADLAIIESAQLGNLNEARAEIETILNEKRQVFELENAGIQAEIARLESIDTRESQARSEQLQIALQERTRLIETQLANERESREFMAQAAANGADFGTLQSIRNAKTPGEALLLAGPWIGRLDRMRTESQLATDSLQRSKLRQDIDAANNTVDISTIIQGAIQDADPVTVKSSIASLLGTDKIAAGTKGRLAPTLNVLNAVDELANQNIEGKFTGVGVAGRIKEGIKGFFNMKDPEATINAQNIEAVNLKVQQWASGAALTEAQTEQVNKFTPTMNDSDKQVKTKLSGLYNFMLNQVEGDLLTDGINVQYPAVNLFEIADLYERASPEQRSVLEQQFNPNQ